MQRHHAPMPPVTTRPIGMEHSGVVAGRMAPPFTGTPSAPAPAAQFSEPEFPVSQDLPWQDVPEDDQGIVEPAFEADVSETEAALAALSHVSAKAEEDFPLDAFIIPEHSRRLPTGLAADAVNDKPANTPVTQLADKLEKLSHRLRVEEASVVIEQLANGDRLDAMLAGLLAGYVAANK